MAHYFFHLHECGKSCLDNEGRECASIADAYRFARESARAIMAEEVQHGQLCLSCYVAIADDARRELVRVLFRDVLTVTGL